MIELSGPGCEDTTGWSIGTVTGYAIYIRREQDGPLHLVDWISSAFNGGEAAARRVAVDRMHSYANGSWEVFMTENKIHDGIEGSEMLRMKEESKC